MNQPHQNINQQNHQQQQGVNNNGVYQSFSNINNVQNNLGSFAKLFASRREG